VAGQADLPDFYNTNRPAGVVDFFGGGVVDFFGGFNT
jgi:hypothetical protein